MRLVLKLREPKDEQLFKAVTIINMYIETLDIVILKYIDNPQGTLLYITSVNL